MKKINLVLGIITLFALASCNKNKQTDTSTSLLPLTTSNVNSSKTEESTTVKEKKVDISSLSVENEYTSDGDITSLNSYTLLSETSSNVQYSLIFKGETEVEFKINLKNPKGESIDAIELYCDDANTMIMVDGVEKKIQYQENENGLKTRIMNWAQEDPYEKTFKLHVSKKDEISLQVVDLKINGEWQGTDLSNNELIIYELGSDVLRLKMIRECSSEQIILGYASDGTPFTEYPIINYKLKFEFDETKISNFCFFYLGNTETNKTEFDISATSQPEGYDDFELMNGLTFTYVFKYKDVLYYRTVKLKYMEKNWIYVFNGNIYISESNVNFITE